MRQVPHYLIIGNGRVARHFSHFMESSGFALSRWHRGVPLPVLKQSLATSSHVIVAISDDAIEGFAAEHLNHFSGVKIHFSGAAVVPGVHGAHPLMTFGQKMYAVPFYSTIPFVVEDDAPDFNDLLPGFRNQHVRIKKSDKARYHALVAMAGNLSCLLWQRMFAAFEKDFGFDAKIGLPYMQQQAENLESDYKAALTGPLARGDQETIKKHLNVLAQEPQWQAVYQAFVTAYQQQGDGR